MENLREGETNGDGESEEVRSSELLVRCRVGEILQRAVRDYGKNTGHRVQVWPYGVPRQNRLETLFGVDQGI